MGNPKLDNSLDVDQVINSLWDEKPIGDTRGDQLAGIQQWLLEECDKLSVNKDENATLKADLDMVKTHVNKSDGTEKEQGVYSSLVLTPESSSSVWYDYRNFSTVDPVSNFVSNPSAEMMGYTHNQPLGPQVYEIYGVDGSTKKEDIQRSCPGVVQNIKTEPLHELKPVQQACLKPAPSQVIYELPQTSSCMYAPGQRAPLNQMMIPPNKENLGTQQVQDFQTIAVPPTCYKPMPPNDVADPTPGMTCQAATHSVPVVPTVQNIDQSESYAEVPNEYVLPAAGNSIVHPVSIDNPQPATTEMPISSKKSCKVQIPYGTEFYCNICEKTFGRKSSFQQHLRQKHQETRPFRCDICGKSYLTENDLGKHRKNHDSSMKPHKCHSCEKSYRHMKDRDRHFETHHGTPSHVCVIESYRHMKDRDRHFETHHGTPSHVCVIEGCTKAFPRRDHMMAHVVSHERRIKRERERAKLRAEKQNNRKQRRCEPREN
ncbi:hypothetical protein RP20_CCG006082 [Aedes albopictus]|nr:hypothetical protein RP20_CCG006082 [Aedes albopictus]